MENSRFKFRAFDKVRKEMNYIPVFLYDRTGIRFTMEQESEYLWETRIYADAFIWNQYTGINDQNGKEVYEGDIVKGKKYGQFVIGVIQYELIHWFLNMNKNMHHLGSISHLEVIGNIYENPELLQVSQ